MAFPSGYDVYKDTVDPGYKIQRIINDEKLRVESKERKVNLAYDTKQRQDALTRNKTYRSNAYHQMFFVAAITVILSLLCVYSERFLPMIPETVVDLLMTAIIIIGVIYLIVLYIDLQRRDIMDYNKVDFGYLLKPPAPIDPTNGETTTTIVSNTITACEGAACCPSGKKFENNKCIEAFTPLPEYSLRL